MNAQHVEHFFSDLAVRVAIVFAIYTVGLLIEEMGRIDKTPNRKGMLLNCMHVLVFHAADLSIGSADRLFSLAAHQ